MAYGEGKNKDEKIVVFDLGWGTFDVTVLEIGSEWTFQAVSYTHLEKIKIPVAKPDTAKIDSTKVVIQTPVSYTHLDVYKRQIYNSFLIWKILDTFRAR